MQISCRALYSLSLGVGQITTVTSGLSVGLCFSPATRWPNNVPLAQKICGAHDQQSTPLSLSPTLPSLFTNVIHLKHSLYQRGRKKKKFLPSPYSPPWLHHNHNSVTRRSRAMRGEKERESEGAPIRDKQNNNHHIFPSFVPFLKLVNQLYIPPLQLAHVFLTSSSKFTEPNPWERITVSG